MSPQHLAVDAAVGVHHRDAQDVVEPGRRRDVAETEAARERSTDPAGD
jgi:hypothetical protein